VLRESRSLASFAVTNQFNRPNRARAMLYREQVTAGCGHRGFGPLYWWLESFWKRETGL